MLFIFTFSLHYHTSANTHPNVLVLIIPVCLFRWYGWHRLFSLIVEEVKL
jgi:hypothetical protein